ncbi:type II secretion system protein [Paracidovorax wautersii]|uniref:General secretion pathway protein J n=1 Tax=Paracidovorax wautersii TaxID=1177982 RepID=A0ABU1I6I4_9BURK|nr:type II secretion system protein [Paracidovorax wautersii]MDR6212835.1 general secretion pathway protein J [Paracidovorax wautersii]
MKACAHSRRQRQQGLTLIELLVTIVILGFTVALMSGAFHQISQILRISSEQSNGFLSRWNNNRALYDIVSNMVLDPSLEKPFVGSYQQVETTTTSPPDLLPGTPRGVRLRLKPSPDSNDVSELWLEPLQQNQNRPPMKLATFAHRVEFRFADHRGLEHQQWPPNGVAEQRPMPNAVFLRDIDEQNLVFRAASYPGALVPKTNGAAQMLGITR